MTPPDIFSQTLLAVPVWLLFELGLFTSRYIAKKDAEKAAREEAELAEEEELPDP